MAGSFPQWRLYDQNYESGGSGRPQDPGWALTAFIVFASIMVLALSGAATVLLVAFLLFAQFAAAHPILAFLLASVSISAIFPAWGWRYGDSDDA